MGATVNLQTALRALTKKMTRRLFDWYDLIADTFTSYVLPYSVGSSVSNPKTGEVIYTPHTPTILAPQLYNMNFWDGIQWVTVSGSTSGSGLFATITATDSVLTPKLDSSGSLLIGPTTATSVTIGRAGIVTNVLNQLQEAGSRVWTASTLSNLNQLTNGPGYISGISGSDVTTALGFTPLKNVSDTLTGTLTITAVAGTSAISITQSSRLYLAPAHYLYSDNNSISTSGSLSAYALLANAANAPARIRGNATDGGSAIGVRISNTNALSTSGAKIVSFYNDAEVTEKAYISKDGYVLAPQFQGWTASSFLVKGNIADGATAVGVILDNNSVLTTTGSKLLSVRNYGTEKVYIGKDGEISITGTSLTDSVSLGTEILTDIGWSSVGWTGSWSTGWIHTVGSTDLLTFGTVSAGARYYVSFTVTNRTVGTFTVSLGGTSAPGHYGTNNIGPTTITTAGLTIAPSSDFNGTIAISVRPMAGPALPQLILKDSAGAVRAESRLPRSTSTFFGTYSGQYNIGSGTYCSGFGDRAAQNTTTGYYATAIGSQALSANTTGYHNTAVGAFSMVANVSGSANTAVGSDSLVSLLSGTGNVAIGTSALRSVTTSANNTALGSYAGRLLSDVITLNATPTGGVYLGYGVNAGPTAGATNETVIGYSATGHGSNTATLGSDSVTNTYLKGALNLLSRGISYTDYKLFDLPNNSQMTGPWNPVFNIVGHGRCIYPDSEFGSSSNSLLVYNNSGGDGVVHLRMIAAANLGTYSQQMDNAAWVKTNTVVTANQAIAPNLVAQGADLVVDNVTDSTHTIAEAYAFTNATQYAVSVFLKQGPSATYKVRLGTVTSAVPQYADFDLTNGTVGNLTGVDSATIVAASSEFNPSPTGWWRVELVFTSANAATTWGLQFIETGDLASYAGTGKGVYIWDFAVERTSDANLNINPPNGTKYVIKLTHNGNITTPNYGGFYQIIPSRANATYVQVFRAMLPVGYTLNINENLQGTDSTSYWSSNNVGTGKWEEYIRVSHCGSTGVFSSGGHISVSGAPAPTGGSPLIWYLASCTCYDITDSVTDFVQIGGSASTTGLSLGVDNNAIQNSAGVWILNTATARSGTNFAYYGDGSNFITNAPSASNVMRVAGVNKFWATSALVATSSITDVDINNISATSGSTLVDSPNLNLRANYWNGSANVAYNCTLVHDILTTAPTSKLSVKFGGVEKVWMDGTGVLYAGSLQSGNTAYAYGLRAYSAGASLILTGNVSDGGTAIGIKIGNANALSTTGAKIVSLYNDNVTTEKAYIDKDGSYHNVTGLWDDVQGPVAQAGGISALTFEAFRDTEYRTYFMRYSQDDTLHLTFQMPHTWDPATSVKPHMHVVPMADPASTEVVRMTGKYAWAQVGVAVPADASWTPFTVDTNVATGDVYKEKIITLATVSPPASPKESDILLVWVRRPGLSDAADTYETGKTGGTASANLCVLSIDTHFQKHKRGTVAEIP